MNLVTDKNRKQYVDEGYCVIKNALSKEYIQDMLDSCNKSIDEIHEYMDENNTDVMGITHRNKRYFISNKYLHPGHEKLHGVLFSDVMAHVTSSLLGNSVFLFNEQFVVKTSKTGTSFQWHQDSGYVGHSNHKPYLTCWIPLVDVSEENGTAFILPYDKAGTKEYVHHTLEEGTNDMVGYFGEEKGIPAVVSTGDIVCFSSTTFHRSGANNTNQWRPVYVAQYSPEVIMSAEGDKPWNQAIPFVKNGKNIKNLATA